MSKSDSLVLPAERIARYRQQFVEARTNVYETQKDYFDSLERYERAAREKKEMFQKLEYARGVLGSIADIFCAETEPK